MPLPPINVGERRLSLPNLPVNMDIGIQEGPEQPGNPVVQDNHDVQEVLHDPAVENVVHNGVGPDLNNGNGQAAQFAANHRVGAGRDWDMHSAEGMLETAQNAVKHIKDWMASEKDFTDFDKALSTAAMGIAVAKQGAEPDKAAGLVQALGEFKQILQELKSARAALTDAVKDGSGASDPREAIAEIRKTLRVFRYELQREMGKAGWDAGKMGFNEGNLRALQNFFTFKVGSKVTETFARIVGLEERFQDALANVRNRMRELDRTQPPPIPPAGLKLANVVTDALEVSHRTNEKIRDFQDADETASTLRGIVGPLVQKGGSRKVEFSIGVGALIGLGIPKTATAGLRVGARVRITGEINAPGKGRPISVTFRFTGGGEAKLALEAGKKTEIAGAKAQVTGGAEASYFTTRTYATLDDLILDADNCKLATSRTIGGAIGGWAKKALSCTIGALGTKFFRWLGRKSGEVKQDNVAYLRSLKERGVVGALDGLLAKRANPMIVGRRYGGTFGLRGEMKGSVNLGAGALDLGASASGSFERDFKVTSRSFTPLAHVARGALDVQALNALMRPGPDGGQPGPVPHYTAASPAALADMLQAEFEKAVLHAEEAAERSKGMFHRTDLVGFARAANEIRTLMLATELAAREEKLPRDIADRFLARYSNPRVKFPEEIFAEYMMDGTGAAKPAKIRTSASASVKVGLLKNKTDDLTKDIGNSFVKAVANGGVQEMRHQVGLDTKVQYRFTSEKPVKADDPRPWENVPRTVHELSITASTPARVIIDAITKTYANKGGRLEDRSPNLGKDIAVGLAKDIGKDAATGALYATLPGFILASVKETAIAAVKKWLADPENVRKLVEFALEHAGDAVELLVNAVEWVADHPDLTLYAVGAIRGASSIGESERSKVLQWSFMDDEFESITVLSQKTNKIGVNVDPVGIGTTVGFDFSYSVTETIKDREYGPTRPLLSFLAKTEEFLSSETGLQRAGNGEALKNWLAKHFVGVQNLLRSLTNPATVVKNTQIYANAFERVVNNDLLREALQDAWRTATTLPADATDDAKLDAAHRLLVALVEAYHYTPPA